MLDRIRDLLRPPTLRPLMLVIPFFFFVHFAGLTSIRPFMVHVFEEYQMPVSGEWATVIAHYETRPVTSYQLCGVTHLHVIHPVVLYTVKPMAVSSAITQYLRSCGALPSRKMRNKNSVRSGKNLTRHPTLYLDTGH